MIMRISGTAPPRVDKPKSLPLKDCLETSIKYPYMIDDRQLGREPTRKTSKFDENYIKNHFTVIPLSKEDIKLLTDDFADQTLGGHRTFTQEVWDRRIVNVYEYRVKIAKFTDGSTTVENHLLVPRIHRGAIVPNERFVLDDRAGTVEDSKTATPGRPKRGRPRKYPVGEEPYKKKTALNYYQITPEGMEDIGKIFTFDIPEANMPKDKNIMFEKCNWFNTDVLYRK